MIDVARLSDSFYGRVGWQEGYRPTDPLINGDILTSSLGRYFNSMSNLLELENLQAIAPDFKNFGYATYVSSTAYAIGQKVMYEGDAYSSKTAGNTGNTPSTDTTNWKHLFSDWLEQKTKNSLFNLAQNIVSLKQLNYKTKSLLDVVYLFDSTKASKTTITKSGRIVGFTFKCKNFEGLMMMLQRVGVQFTQTETLNLYLYHTSQIDAPIATLSVSVNTPLRFQWYDFQERMTFLEDYNAQGEYKLVYYEDDLTGEAIEYALDNTGGNLSPCSSCNGNNQSYNYYKAYTKWLNFQAFYVDAVNIPVTALEMWDTDDEVNVNRQNWGLNVQLDARCDITNIVTNNRDIFTNAIVLQLELDMAKEMVRDTRTSTNNSSVQKSAALELEGGIRDLKSLTSRLNEEIKIMDFNISDLHGPCAPCNNKRNGVTYGYL